MTEIPICDTPPRVGRKMLYPDKIVAPLPAGSLKRMEAVLREGEDKTDLLREAVEEKIASRERLAKRKAAKPPQ